MLSTVFGVSFSILSAAIHHEMVSVFLYVMKLSNAAVKFSRCGNTTSSSTGCG